MTWHKEASKILLEGNYIDLARFYEQLVETEPEVISHYWYLGLAYLLQAQEEDAQTTWLLVMSQAEGEQVEQWTNELVNILDTEAQRQEQSENYQLSWLIRGHIQEIDSGLINNLLHLINLEIKLNTFTPKSLIDWEVLEVLQQSNPEEVDSDLLLDVLLKAVTIPSEETLKLAELSLAFITNIDNFVKQIMAIARHKCYDEFQSDWAASLTELCLKFYPDNLLILRDLSFFYTKSRNFQRALEVTRKFYNYAVILPLKVFATYQMIYLSITIGYWLELEALIKEYKILLREMIQTGIDSIDLLTSEVFILFSQPLLYLQDDLAENRWFQNQISRLFQDSIKQPLKAIYELPLVRKPHKPLRIGYLSQNFKRHSIGWLSRWLFHYYDREAFEFIIYLVSQPEDDITRQWFRKNASITHNLDTNVLAIADKIKEDQIDILVDIESMSYNLTCQVMALKPAPIQVTWLGMDASGLPTIDYFIADPYVLPEDAEKHYQEKIWRLPNTYLGINGFEVAYPTLRREQLDIPNDGIVYLIVQNSFKLYPDTIRLQIHILKEVPNSYLLIKGIGDQQTLKELFSQLATERGVNPERLRFLSPFPTEEIHRGNLTIADVVLDTYPYNGATTTLEVLWMGIPLVTKVGQQFAARNSYTFMVNAGIQEGIAWTDDEYIQWGIRLGTDENLRKNIAWKLRQGRKTAPLWNAQQFTRDMEKAYQQMWDLVNS